MTPGDFLDNTTANAVGGIVTGVVLTQTPKLWARVQPFVHALRERALPQAQARFEANAATLVQAVEREIAGGAPSPEDAEARLHGAARRLEDPDVAIAFGDALRAGGRIPSEDRDRHAALAKIVAARLAAPDASVQAAAANLAVRAVETLGPPHLRALALLALVHYAGRPNAAADPYPALPPDPPPYDPAGPAAEQAAAQDAYEQAVAAATGSYAERHAARVCDAAARLAPPAALSAAVALHLEASGCVLRRESTPDLPAVLARPLGSPTRPPPAPGGAFPGGAFPAADDVEEAVQGADDGDPTSHLEYAIARACRAEFHYAACDAERALPALAALWTSTLRHLAPTPAGLLIGLAAYDALTGEHRTAEWRWAGVAERALALPLFTPDPPFARWAADRGFQAAVDRAVADRSQDRRRAAGDNTARW